MQFAKLEFDFAVKATLEHLHHAGVTGDAFANRCGFRTEASTLEQSCAEVPFEFGQCVTDCRLGQVQLARGAGQAAMFDDGEEDVELCQRELAHGSRVS